MPTTGIWCISAAAPSAVLVWWSVIEPKRRRLPGDLWKVPYVIGARMSGMFLGMAFIIMRTPAYGEYYGATAPDHGLSAITDQQVAGGMMLALDLVVMLFAELGNLFAQLVGQDKEAAWPRVQAGMRRLG